MNLETLEQLVGLPKLEDFENIPARYFEKIVCAALQKFGKVKTQVSVKDRGDGRKGKIDIVFVTPSETVAIEIDRKFARAKSIFKVRSISPNAAFIILRSPYRIIQV